MTQPELASWETPEPENELVEWECPECGHEQSDFYLRWTHCAACGLVVLPDYDYVVEGRETDKYAGMPFVDANLLDPAVVAAHREREGLE